MKVCLTFDAEFPDQPHNVSPLDGVPRILAALSLQEVEATFFMQGKWVRANPRLAKLIADDGHQIGNHSYSHAGAQELTPAAFEADVERAKAVIHEATGVIPEWYRFPYGQMAHWGTWNIPKVAGWNVDSEDYKPSNAGTGDVRAMVGLRTLEDEANIILMHTWPQGTATDLLDIIRDLKDRGAEFGTLEGGE
jgi:peptidoglycan/xylan/chitin deacetylase (PgdA/CDA1 family)